MRVLATGVVGGRSDAEETTLLKTVGTALKDPSLDVNAAGTVATTGVAVAVSNQRARIRSFRSSAAIVDTCSLINSVTDALSKLNVSIAQIFLLSAVE